MTATLPDNLASYDEYYLELSDTLSTGLTYNKDTKVYLVNGTEKTDITSSFTIAADSSSFKINNLKSLNGVTSQVKPLMVAPFLVIFILIVLLLVVNVYRRLRH